MNAAPEVSQVSAEAGTVENPVVGTSTTLSATASDDGGSGNLIYTWSLSYSDGGQAYFGEENGTHDASSIEVTFTQAGEYVFNLEVEDACGLTDPPISIHVAQTLTSIVVTPGDAAVLQGTTRQFAAAGIDQFGNDMMNQPSFTWAVVGGVGSINSSGLYTPPSNGGDASFSVSASADGKTGMANVVFRSKPSSDESWVYDQANSLGTPSVGSPHNLNLLAPATFSITDAFIVGDVYEVYDNGNLILTTTSDESSPYSHGEVNLNTGSHSLTVKDTTDWVSMGHPEWYPAGLYYRIDTANQFLLELTVADHATPSNKTTAITDQAIKDLYLNEDLTTHVAKIDFDVLYDPKTSETGKDIHLKIERSDGFILFNDDLSFDFLVPEATLKVTEQARDFVLTAWLDENHNGLYDTGEDKREVDVHVISLRSDNNGDSVVNKIDDALNTVQPNALNLEGNGPRTEVDLKIGAAGGSGGGYKVVVPNVAGLEFWTAATGGTQLTADANGNIIDTALSGACARTIWVSAATATMLSATANAAGGAAGDAKIQMQVKNQAGQTVTQTWIGVNRPVEVLYAVDGTSQTAANNANVRQFEQRYQGVDGTDRHYYNGPQNVVNGTDSPGIVTNVENQIQADYATALQRHRRLVIDLVGWSRGAVIVGTVARDLNTVNLTATTFVIQPTAIQHISVHWVGLFDAVSQMGDDVNAPHNAWARAFSANVLANFHLIHTNHGSSRDYYPLNEDYLFPTEMGFTPTTPFNTPNGSSHSDVGTNRAALNRMINNARAAGVPVR